MPSRFRCSSTRCTPWSRSTTRTTPGCSTRGDRDEPGFGSYEVVLFDPDHVPVPSYLERVLGYVQPAQVYYNQRASFIARGAAEGTYGYYSVMQMTYHGLGHPMVTGCHRAHRVSVLRAIGGLAPHEADDLLTTHEYRVAGCFGVYVPEVLARGITPRPGPPVSISSNAGRGPCSTSSCAVCRG